MDGVVDAAFTHHRQRVVDGVLFHRRGRDDDESADRVVYGDTGLLLESSVGVDGPPRDIGPCRITVGQPHQPTLVVVAGEHSVVGPVIGRLVGSDDRDRLTEHGQMPGRGAAEEPVTDHHGAESCSHLRGIVADARSGPCRDSTTGPGSGQARSMVNTTNIGPDLVDAAAALHGDTIELRRAIHAEPEIGLQLPDTQAKILDAISELGLEVTVGESTTSVVADLDTGRDGPTVLLRGDMDALPLTEDYETEFQSRREGIMHACGHDTHVAMLVGAARLLADNKNELTGRVRFMFQPGEEGYHGAKYMIDEGVLDGVDRAFAIHVSTTMPNGMVFTRGGSLLASADRFEITVHGEGGHASAPHNCTDPIPGAAATVTGLHTMVGRDTDPTLSGLVTVAHIESGTTNNIIPPSAFLEGTIRALDEKTRSNLRAGVERVAQGTATAHGCTCSCEVIPGYPVTVNDPAQAELTGEVATTLLGEDRFRVMPRGILAAEDFSYVLQEVPGAMAMLGVCPDDLDPTTAAPNHSNLMRVNESALSSGVALYAAMALVA